MRRLFLLRHADPEEEPADDDRARPLSALGHRQAAALAGVLRARVAATTMIEHVLCSPAVRTRQTLGALELDAPVEVVEKLYFCGTNTLLQRIGEVDGAVQSLLVVGHSPPVPGLAARLAQTANPQVAENLWSHYPPGTLTEFEVDGDWPALVRMPYALGRLVGVHQA